MNSKVYTIFGIVFLIQVLVVKISETRNPPPRHWSEQEIRHNTNKKNADAFTVSVTLCSIADYIYFEKDIAEARSCYVREEKDYREAVWDFAEKINSIYNNIRDKYQNDYKRIVGRIQGPAFHLINKVRDNPFNLYGKLKSGKLGELHTYLKTIRSDVSFFQYEFDIWMKILLQQRYFDNELIRCDEEIIRIHVETANRCKEIYKKIESCYEEYLNEQYPIGKRVPP